MNDIRVRDLKKKKKKERRRRRKNENSKHGTYKKIEFCSDRFF